ncbi:hypothetical protein GSI_10558 [Ganoderma sinense ZZ0214-1]|uniref:DUF6533 domain-containing protein n=1 Tax=Ganoderma sinense ZZ0214-1 TaxID=1077348 RepID=A0A2G8S0W3_9APHY|nr:hypothetical protein GSI_10558 [Ganoderma sinense ZZ0214-1]
MSSQSDSAVDDAWIAFYSAEFSNGYCAIAVAALTAYDWVLTLPREGQFFWTGKARPISAILYFSNKYLNLFTVAIATPLWQAPLSDQLFASSSTRSSQNTNIQLTVLIVTRMSAILADTLLIAITIWKFRHENLKVATMNSANVSAFLIGILYFIVLVVLNTLHLVLTEVSIGSEGPTSLVSNFTIPLSSILVSHFILDLQEVSQRTAIGLASNDALYTSNGLSERSVHFASALGSLGATIEPGRDLEDAFDEESPNGSSTMSQFSPSDGCGSSRHTKTDDGFAIMEIRREFGEGEVVLGP